MQTKADNAPSTQDPQQEQPEQPLQDTPEPPEQELRAAPAEIDEESALRGESNNLSDATETDVGQKDSLPNDPASEEHLPFPVPREICLHIFSFLNTQNLQRTALMSRQSYVLSTLVRQQQFLKKYSKSHWWKFLVALADNVPGEGEKKFVEVLILGMGPNVQIPDGWRDNNPTLSAYVTRWIGDFPEKIQRLGFGVSGYEDIQKRAQTLLAVMCTDNGRMQFNACTQLKDCFVLVEDKNKIVACQQYDDLDRLFSSFILFRFIRGSQANNRLNYLINSPFSRGLTGEGLIALESQFQGIFPALVREAIRLFQIEEKQEADSQRLKAIEKLLGRLTEADILRYIDTEAHGPKFTLPTLIQRQIFIEVLSSNYEFLMAKMTYSVLIRVEHTVDDPNKFESLLLIPHIFKSHFILSKLKPNELLSLLKILRRGEVANVINDHPMLHSFCTVEIMEELLIAKTDCSEVTRVFLSNKTLLDKLSDDNIITFLAHIDIVDFETLLGIDTFRTRLRGSPNNDLLIRLARSNKIYTMKLKPIKNLDVFDSLTGDQAIELFDYKKIYFVDVLFHNKSLMAKLSSSQLLHFICKCGYEFHAKLIQEHLHKLMTNDFVLLIQIALSDKKAEELKKALFASLPNEIERRVSAEVSADYRLDSEALSVLGCAHQQLACFILEHHAEKLNTRDYLSIRDHYPAYTYDANTPIRIAIAREKQRRLEKLEARSKPASPKTVSTTISPPPSTTTRDFSSKPNNILYRKPIPPLVTDEEWSWVYFIIQLICIVGAVFGLFLALSGVGSAAGIGMMTSVTTFLFASLPMSSALVTGILGFGIFIASSIGWLMTDEAKTARFGGKNNSSQVENEHATRTPQFREPHVNRTKAFSINDSTFSKQVDPSHVFTKDDRDEDSQFGFSINNQ